MKLDSKHLDSVIGFPLQKHKPAVIKNGFQLAINLFVIYIANEITVDIWRSLTRH